MTVAGFAADLNYIPVPAEIPHDGDFTHKVLHESLIVLLQRYLDSDILQTPSTAKLILM